MPTIIDLTGRFDAAFGFAASNIIPRIVRVNPFGFDNYTDNNPEFEDITLRYPDRVLNFASFPFVVASKQAFTVPFLEREQPDISNIIAPPPMITFARDKKLIVTELNDQDTEVVERWNTGAYDVRIRGLLVDMEGHNYPSDAIRAMHKLFEYNDTIEVAGTQFYEKDISYIYLKDIEIVGVTGYKDTMQYTITARSARDVSFTLINPNS